ncbi:hypothetical protein CXA84_06785 [Campylobacter upsaliensis]|nr:hypothetical protein [Campylobacter upsaliensis]EAK3772456.1 hypothetical protein [Campylobacter upsaliensis]
MLLEVSIDKHNKDAIISAINLIKGVELVEVLTQAEDYDDTIMTKEDYEAWVEARKDLAEGKTISHEELKRLVSQENKAVNTTGQGTQNAL